MTSVPDDNGDDSAPSGDEVKRNLYQGSAAAVLRVLLAIPIYIVLTPFTLKYLGTLQFALWSFSATIIGVVNLADLGFKSSLMYHCANHWSDRKAMSRLFGTAVFMYAGFWLVMMMVMSLWLTPFTNLLGIPLELSHQGRFVVIMTMISFGLRFVAMPCQAMIESRYGVSYSQNVLLLWLLLNAIATLLLLPLFPTIYAMGWISVCSNAIVFVAFYWRVLKLFPWLTVSMVRFDRDAARRLLGYGVGVYLATIMIVLREPLFKLFLSHGYGLAAVADFEIAFRFCTQIISAVISPLLGTFAAAAILAGRPDEMVRVLRPLCGFALLLLPPLAIAVFFFSGWLIPLWIHDAGIGVLQMLPWMFVAFALYYLSEVLYQSLLAAGMSNYSGLLQFTVLASCAAVLLVAKLAAWNHSIAVGAAMTTGFALFSVINVRCFQAKFQRNLFTIGTVTKLFVPSLLFCYIAWGLRGQYLQLLTLYLIYLLIHIVVARWLRVADLLILLQRVVGRTVLAGVA